MKTTPMLIALLCASCAGTLTPAQQAARNVCRGDVYQAYIARTDECADEACIDAERPRLQSEQEACP